MPEPLGVILVMHPRTRQSGEASMVKLVKAWAEQMDLDCAVCGGIRTSEEIPVGEVWLCKHGEIALIPFKTLKTGGVE